MNKSTLFVNAHHKTRLAMLKAAILRHDFNYQVVFTFYLREEIAAQAVKNTVYNGNITTIEYIPKRKINKSVALVGDYKKPTIVRDGLKIHNTVSPSLTVTYNLDTLLSLVISAITVISLYYIALQAITN